MCLLSRKPTMQYNLVPGLRAVMFCGREGNRGSGGKVDAYRRVCGFGHLRADCPGPGSAPDRYSRIYYGNTFSFTCSICCWTEL